MKSVIPVDASLVSNYVRNVALYYFVVSYVLNLNKYANLVRQEGGNKVRMSSKGLPRLGTLFSQILSSVSCYNIPLIKFKITLEILTPEVKKKTQKFTPQLVSERE